MPRILVVDDEKDLVDFLVALMQREGWEAGLAYNGEEAVRKVREAQWDAVLMDIRMPTLDGLDALQQMRQHCPQLAVVLFTGQAGQGDMLNAFRLGAYQCLLKPLDSRQVVTVLKEAMERSQPGEPGQPRRAAGVAGADDETLPER